MPSGGVTSFIQTRNVNLPGLRAGRRVEDDVVGAGRRRDRADDRLDHAEQLVRVVVDRERGEACEAVLVAGDDEPR